MAREIRRINRGSATVKVSAKHNIKEIRNVSETGEVTPVVRKNFGRFESAFINKEGNFQYLVGYSPSHSASIQLVRPILEYPLLPSLLPSKQGEIIELKLYYLDEDGYRKVKTYDAEGSKFHNAYKRWMNAWDKICES